MLLNKGADPNKAAKQFFSDGDAPRNAVVWCGVVWCGGAVVTTPLKEVAERDDENYFPLSIEVVRSLLARGARQDLDKGGEQLNTHVLK